MDKKNNKQQVRQQQNVSVFMQIGQLCTAQLSSVVFVVGLWWCGMFYVSFIFFWWRGNIC